MNMKNDLEQLIEWFQANKLSLNLSKTNYVLFRPNKKVKMHDWDDETEYYLKVGTETLTARKEVKFLGITIDKYLSWSSQCKSVGSKISSALYVLRSVKNFLPTYTLITLYYSFVYSHIQYGLILWGTSASARDLDRVRILQKKSIRQVKNAKYNASTLPICKELDILEFNDISKMELSKLMYQYSVRTLPCPLMNIFTRNCDLHDYDTRNKENALCMKRNYAQLHNSFLCKAPAAWQCLAIDIKNCKNIKSFSKMFKKYLIKNY